MLACSNHPKNFLISRLADLKTLVCFLTKTFFFLHFLQFLLFSNCWGKDEREKEMFSNFFLFVCSVVVASKFICLLLSISFVLFFHFSPFVPFLTFLSFCLFVSVSFVFSFNQITICFSSSEKQSQFEEKIDVIQTKRIFFFVSTDSKRQIIFLQSILVFYPFIILLTT